MADFCKQCSVATFGDDFGDLKFPDVGKDQMVGVICEGCGPCFVDSEGACITPDCMERHG